MDILYGVIGLIGFEALRVYKRIMAGLPVVPGRNRGLYVLTMCSLGVFAGAAAHALANGSIANSLFVGFSVPTGLKALSDNPRKDSEGKASLTVEDIDILKPNLIQRCRHWMFNFFRFN